MEDTKKKELEEENLDVVDVPEPYHKGISIEHILTYKKKGLSHEAIAKLLGCSKTNVTTRLKPYAEELDTLTPYKDHRADIMAMTGRRMLKYITDDKLQKATAYQLTGMFGIMSQTEQNERGINNQANSSINIVINAIRTACSDNKIVDVTPSKG